jgi:HEAT repeat protein
MEPGPRRKLSRTALALCAAASLAVPACGAAIWVLVPRWWPAFTIQHSPWVQPVIRAVAFSDDTYGLVQRMTEWKATALPGIELAYADRSPLVRRSSIEAAGMIPDRAALPFLRRAIADPDPGVRELAIHAASAPFEASGDPQGVATLLPSLDDTAPAVRLAAVEALTQIGGTAGETALAAMVVDDDPDVRRTATSAASAGPLARLARSGEVAVPGHHVTARRLAELTLGDENDEQVEWLALEALCRLDDPTTLSAVYDAMVRRGMAPEDTGGPANEPGPQDTEFANPTWLLIHHLYQRDPKAERLVRDGLESTLLARRLASVRWLPQVRVERRTELVQDLLRMLHDPDLSVQNAAFTSLRALATTETQQPLLELARSGRAEERRLGVALLGQVPSPEAAMALVHSLTDADGRIRSAAYAALVSCYRASAVGQLLELSRHADGEILQLVVAALGELGGSAVEPEVIPYLDHPEPHMRWIAASALSRVGTPAALAPLIAHLADDDAEVRAAIALALARCGSGAVPVLKRMLDDGDPEVVVQARQSLRAFEPRPPAPTSPAP